MFHTPRVLITDDDRDFRETIAGVLGERGFETLQAGDGEEALSIVQRQEVHLLLLDMQMPRLSGLETIERLREVSWSISTGSVALEAEPAKPEAATPLKGVPRIIPLPWILISGCLDEQLIARAKAAAVFSVLPKPVRLPALTSAVAGALAQAYDWRAA